MKREVDRWGKRYIIPILIFPICYLLQRMYIYRGERIFGKAFFSQAPGTVGVYSKINEVCDPEQMAGIVKRFLFECFRVYGACSQIKMLWFSLFVLGVMFAIKKYRKEKDSVLGFLVVFCPIVIITYLLGVMVTYFTFNSSEANENYLACFYRYVGTIAILIVFIMCYYFLSIITTFEFNRAKDYILSFLVVCSYSGACVIAGVSPFYIFGFKYYHPVEEYTTDAWEFLEANCEERWAYNTDVYVMYVNLETKSFDNYDKLVYVLNTYFRSLYCEVCDIKDDTSYIDELFKTEVGDSERNTYIINYY